MRSNFQTRPNAASTVRTAKRALAMQTLLEICGLPTGVQQWTPIAFSIMA
jgi:hypothetical protein